MTEILALILCVLLVLIYLWAVVDVVRNILKHGIKFKTYWIWLVVMLPPLGAIIYLFIGNAAKFKNSNSKFI